MKIKIGSSAAVLIGAGALLAGRTEAAPHFSGGGGHFGGHAAGAHSFASGGHFSGTRGAWTGGGHWGGNWGGHHWGGHHWGGGGWWGPGWGWGWYDPFFWGGVGFVAGYDLAPYWGDYYDDPGDYAYPPPGATAPASPGYDCDGWRWEPGQQRYVPAKVACQ